ncbi:518_t:CDS:2 [Ambispora gerdemannii]|uniref:518_t:CDS:1 n=1 Tax=Ambispora gerdemannii TaxID=144530 RepID=A0A9N8UW58_9GLOM|nr:518_t:CDS:2 [Ambispora gerdemannii]
MSWVLATSYIVGMLMVMSTFSYFWRRRKNAGSHHEPWFTEHKERDIYITLLQQDPPVDEILLKSALLRRAVTDIQRISKLRDDKQALANLVQKGAVGDDLWTAFLEAENELGQEINAVILEANTFTDEWGRYIFTNAGEMVRHQKLKDIKNDMKELKEREEKAAKRREEREKIETEENERKEKARLEKERKKAQEELLKDEEAQKKKKAVRKR